MNRGLLGRDLARAELAGAAFVGFVVAPFLYVAAPAGFSGMFPPPDWQVTGPIVVGAAGILIGFTWMVRIYRADPEPDQRAWRYRQRD
jgi:hypothetical protein